MMKKILFPVLALVLAVGVALPTAMPAVSHTESEPEIVDLLAGQDEDVGDVLVWNDGDNIYVKYVLDTEAIAEGWVIVETHLYVGKNPPPTSAPGQFPYDDADASVTPTEVTYVIALDSICNYTMQLNSKGKVTGVMTTDGDGDVGVGPCDDVYIAAHAVVVRPIAGCWETVWQIGDVETYGCDDATLLTNYADEFNWGEPAGPCTAGPNLGVEQPAYTDPFIVGTTPTNEFPFNSNSGQGYATDFDVQWDGGLLFGGQLTISWSPGASYPSETKVVSGDGISATTFVHAGVASPGQGWFLNKYPLYQDSVAVSPLSGGTHTINFRHTAGDGTYWDWVRLEEPCQQEETAWGDGELIGVNSNWSMYFGYEVQCQPPELINGDFEFPVVTASQGWDIYDSGFAGLGWTVEWADEYGGAPDPAHLELHRGVYGWLPYTGDQYAELDTDWGGPGDPQSGEPASVRIYQDIATCPCKTYTLTYAWSPRPNHGDNQLDVYWDGTLLGTSSPMHSASGGSQTSWTVETWNGLVPSGTSTRLEFVETGTADSLGMFLDAVSLVEE